MESVGGGVLRGVRLDPQRGSAELSGGQLPLAGPPVKYSPGEHITVVRVEATLHTTEY